MEPVKTLLNLIYHLCMDDDCRRLVDLYREMLSGYLTLLKLKNMLKIAVNVNECKICIRGGKEHTIELPAETCEKLRNALKEELDDALTRTVKLIQARLESRKRETENESARGS